MVMASTMTPTTSTSIIYLLILLAGAAGGYFATPTDVTRWMRTYMRGDILSAATMTEAKTTVAAPGLPSTTYGLGLMRKVLCGV
jgi:CubicO group peptidase (beta-lactamase class C family)